MTDNNKVYTIEPIRTSQSWDGVQLLHPSYGSYTKPTN